MDEPIAVIDLGTNTFHLLISRPGPNGSGFEELYRERRFVKLAEKGIEWIHPDSFRRGQEALAYFRKRLDEYGVTHCKALGTAALRTASNGPEFQQQAWEQHRIRVELISGEEEARLIQQGVALAVPLKSETDLIMDIGGGSVEFILANRDRVLWSASFPVGVAVLFRHFQAHDPILPEELKQLRQFLKKELESLSAILQEHPPRRLIGASGTFDVLENLAVKEKEHPLRAELPIDHFPAIYDQLIYSTLAERKRIEGIPMERAEMIVVAMELLRWVITRSRVAEMVISAYAMKEGIMKEMLEGKD